MRKSALVIDANNLISRCIFASALDDLRAGGNFTGGVYGALASLRSILSNPQLVGVGAIYAFFDNGVPARRMRLLPDYKQARRDRRETMPEEERERALSQIARCYTLWPMLGVSCLSYQDREADDGVAAAAQILVERGALPIVVSSDRDLFQTVALGAEVFDLRTNEILSTENFEEHSDGVPMPLWLVYRALVGDTSDGIRGVPGLGPKRAKQLLSEVDFEDRTDPHEQLRHLCAFVRDKLRTAKKPKKCEQDLLSHEDHVHRVLKAIDLRGSFGPLDSLRARMRDLPPITVKPFLRECRDLQFASVLGDPLHTLAPFQRAQELR